MKKNNILIFDNLFDDIFIKKIENIFLSSKFKWELSLSLYTCPPKVTENFKLNNLKEYILFVHDFYKRENNLTFKKSTYSYIVDDILIKILEKLNITNVKILRSKANFQTQFTENSLKYFNTPHVDFLDFEHTVFLYYVNDSDGDTIFFDKDLNITDRISPKKGRVVIFDGKTLHTGSHPVDSKYRFVINIDVEKY